MQAGSGGSFGGGTQPGFAPPQVGGGTDLITPLIAGAAQYASTRDTNKANAKIAKSTNATNIKLAADNTAFQERMSNSAYQRAMADMGKAGLNPMLAFQQGGASSPAGSVAKAESPNYQDPLGGAVNSAMNVLSTKEKVKMAQRQIMINEAQSEVDLVKKAADTQKTVASAKKADTEVKSIKADLARKNIDADYYDTKAGKTLRTVEKATESVGNSISNIIGGFSLRNFFGGKKGRPMKGKGTLKPRRNKARWGN